MVKVEITAAAKKDLQQICHYLTMKTFSFSYIFNFFCTFAENIPLDIIL